MTLQRLQKILAAAGVASRRSAEELITAGRVRVNGKVVRELGAKADGRADKITVDGKTLVRERHVYFLLHKPRGYVTTLSDPEGRPTVMDILKEIPERIFPVGRLDWNTAGALLFTNDGDLAQALMHPKRKVLKTYAVKLQGHPTEQTLEQWRSGVQLDDGKTAPAEVWTLSEGPGATWLKVGIREGKNRQIHRMGEATGHTVLRLTRTEFAGLGVDELRPGEYRPLTATETDDLRQEHLFGVVKPARPPSRGGKTAGRDPMREDRGPRQVPDDDRRPRSGPPATRGRPDARPPRRGPDFEARGADGRGPRPDVRKSDSRGPRSDSRGPRSEPRGPRPDPRSEGRAPKTDSRGPKSDGRPAIRDERKPRIRDERPARSARPTPGSTLPGKSRKPRRSAG